MEKEFQDTDNYLVEVQQLADEHGRDKVLEIAKKILLPALVVGLCLGTLNSQTRKYICKVTHLGTNDAAITCLNGADPTGNKVGSVLIISCGK